MSCQIILLLAAGDSIVTEYEPVMPPAEWEALSPSGIDEYNDALNAMREAIFSALGVPAEVMR